MAHIRYFNIFDILKLKQLVTHISDEKIISYNRFLYTYPLSVINNFLPLNMKFKSDSFVAIQDGKIKAILTIKSRRNNPLKWQIKRLLLDENAYETGEQLINYVVAKYGAEGAETVEVKVNENDNGMIDLFSKACGFRYCLDYVYYKLDYKKFLSREIDDNRYIFRPYKSNDEQSIANLYNFNIQTFYKFPLSKSKKEFSESVFRGLYKTSLYKYVLEDRYKKQICGYVQINTADNINFNIEVVLLQSFENYYKDAITFAVSQISKRTNKFNLFIKNNRFHQNSEDFEKQLKKFDAETFQTDMIFVKDFFKQIKEGNNLVKPAIIYNEIGRKPAFERKSVLE